jgi:hypothetical protein
MKDIAEINVTQVRIYPSDAIPFQELSAGKNPEVLRDALQFREIQPEGRGLAFSNGLFVGPHGPTVVSTLSVDPRRILLRVRGRSAQAHAVQRRIWEVLASISASRVGSAVDSPLVTSQETNCVATLAISFDELVAPTLLRFLRGNGKTLLSVEAGAAKGIDFQSLAFTVSYDTGDPSLQERGVALVNKPIIVQPRAGTAIREKRFFTSSPTDSETHIALVEKLEADLLSARPR